MSKYKQLTKEDRIEIASLIKSGKLNQTEIALQLGKNRSSISRELSRNKDLITGNYNYSTAHKLAKVRKTKANQLRTKIVLNGEMEEYILEKLKLNWSPEQIAGRLKVTNPLKNLEPKSNQEISKVDEVSDVSKEMNQSINQSLKQEISIQNKSILSHQTIYDYIYLNRPDWKKYLRIIGKKGRYRRKYGTKIREKLREESRVNVQI